MTPAIQIGVVVALLAALWWAVDAVGDQREAAVHARYAAAAEATNVDLRAFNTEDERVAAIAEAARQKALANAEEVESKGCPATQEQADALNRIL